MTLPSLDTLQLVLVLFAALGAASSSALDLAGYLRRERILERLKPFTPFIVAFFINAVFLGIWILVTFVVFPRVVTALAPVSSAERWIIHVFQVLFAVSTLVPVGMYVYVDLRVFAKRLYSLPDQGKAAGELENK